MHGDAVQVTDSLDVMKKCRCSYISCILFKIRTMSDWLQLILSKTAWCTASYADASTWYRWFLVIPRDGNVLAAQEMKNKFKDRSNYATWLGPSCKLCPAVAVVPRIHMYNSEICHQQRRNKGVFCYQTFLKSICFLIHPMLTSRKYLEVLKKKILD